MINNSQSDIRNKGELFPGKIAVITDDASISGDDFYAADRLIAKYGSDKIVHVTWPENFIDGQDKMIDTVVALAADREIKALIITQAVPGTNAALDKLREIRDDVFIIYCTTQESSADAVKRANLLLNPNHLGMGRALVKQAKKQGAKVFVHYSFPRHMAQPQLSNRRNLIRQECLKNGILFTDVTVPDPTGEGGITGSREFISANVPELVKRYGEKIAFFSTNCQFQTTLLKAVVDCHAIYPQPCCPSPYLGFPEALGIDTGSNRNDYKYMVSEIRRVAREKKMSGRLSTWPVSASMMFSNAAAEYAIKWINCEVSRDGIDNQVLLDCINAYVIEVTGEPGIVYLTSLSEKGVIYENFKLVLMSYLDF